MLNKFGHCFPAAVQEQGQALFQQGLVRGVFGSDEGLQVEILDAGGAEASWQVSRNRLVPNCSCQDFQAGKLCCHLWAALLLADSQGDLGKARRKCVAGKICLAAAPPPAPAPSEPDYQTLEPVQSGRRRSPPDDFAQEPQVNVRLRRRDRPPEPVLPGLNPACDSPEILYVLCEDKLQGQDEFLRLETWWKQQRPDGRAGCRPFYPEAGSQVSSQTDFQTLALLLRKRQERGDTSGNEFRLPPGALQEFFALQAGSCHLRWSAESSQGRQFHRLQVPAVFAAELEFSFVRNEQGQYEVQARMQTAERPFALEEIRWLGLCGAAVAGGCLFQVHFAGAERTAWELWQAAINQLKARARTYFEALALARSLFLAGNPRDTSWPRELRCQVCRVQVRGVLFVKTGEYKFAGREQLHADLSFDYEGRRCTGTERQARLPGTSLNQVLERDFEAEAGLQERLLQLGFQPEGGGTGGYRLLPAKLEGAVLALVMEDWLVTAAGRTYCKPGEKKAMVKGAGLDWFEIKGEVDFKGQKMPLPKLLQALQRGASSVRLDDGTYGILPREWLEKFTALTEIGETTDQRVLLHRRQAALVQALLRERLQDADGQFTAVAEALQHPPVPGPRLPPQGFQGTLRPYQQDGLGWLLAMRDLGLGGCLADDMGLGKTVQVLALLCWQKQSGSGKTSLVVAPKSLLFNWMSEAARFAPALRCRSYAGPGRERILAELQQSDLLLTTYGTLRADVELLSRCAFDYCILDESQAIKNGDSATAKAVRTIKAEHRLAMTGTPVENRLNELFSQLEFLNPGLLGEKFLAGCSRIAYDLTEEQTLRLRRALHPFLLRRTKSDVARDLPVKTEKVLFCELDESQQQSYAELKEFYRQELLQAPGAGGGGKIKALAALLRLRQAACHPGLLDSRLASQPSAKLEVLLDRLHTLAEAGQKALIFSQFSQFLRLLEPHLQQQGLKYCYLDGQTQNRGELVQQFQEDPRTLFFLISLKAGGTGLNLTAAEYVFLLDPWWNPAAESQAVDRAYRIGQKKPVFAYRLIAKNTVEEKVLQMQEAKRHLASALLEAAPQKGLPLQLEDLRFLLQ
ncbi:MAG: DEAD/DEAH box helicase [Oligosphaeraceae bacterium]|nr:DEAD/DEAH box helicase [Oligosphaeraceae bacterium]